MIFFANTFQRHQLVGVGAVDIDRDRLGLREQIASAARQVDGEANGAM
jgi:hypothetical protein